MGTASPLAGLGLLAAPVAAQPPPPLGWLQGHPPPPAADTDRVISEGLEAAGRAPPGRARLPQRRCLRGHHRGVLRLSGDGVARAGP
jgi:hypothetical protein